MHPLITAYLAQLLAIQQTGAAQPEQSYYVPLQAFLTGAAEALHHGHVNAILQPQHQDYGVPDFQVQQEHTIVGWVEAKPLAGALNHNTKQLRQYRSALHNLLLTNFLTFRLFINGNVHGEVQLAAAPGDIPTPLNVDLVSQLLTLFFQQSVPAIQSAAQLADALALRARFLRHAVTGSIGLPPVQTLRNAYTQFLFPGIEDDAFADLVAETIVYTLFAAWSQAQFGDFTLAHAAASLPPNIPLLQNLFNLTVSNPALVNTPIGIHIESVANLLSSTDPGVLHVGVGEDVQEEVGDDPVMYFYQPFLHAYSKRTAKARGVYYTPLPAVRAMVRMADSIARNVYSRQPGLAGPNVFVLDPAAGTGTFLVQVGRQIIGDVQEVGDAGLLGQYLRQRFIEHTYGFEFLAAPYTIAHLKLARFLHDECGIAPTGRMKVYLTNTLQTPQFAALALPLLEALAEENQAATAIKTEEPLLVIIGNPPWSGHSENLNAQLQGMDAVEPFKWCDGVRVNQTKWLNNDYVKFIRWSQWRITENEHVPDAGPQGVVVLITDNSYLSSPTFRGMRRYLLTQFDRIHMVNLHGNIRTGGAGVPDENIFDIRQGVCIGIFIRGGTLPPAPDHAPLPAQPPVAAPSPFLCFALPATAGPGQADAVLQALSQAPIRATVTYLSCEPGTRADKYGWLNDLNWAGAQAGALLTAAPPFYFFTPFDMDGAYFSWPALNEYMPEYSMCVTTGNDATRVFLTEAELLEQNPGAANSRQYLYRPFDVRWVNHTNELERPRREVMQHFYQPNVGLVAVNQVRRGGSYNYRFVTSRVTDKSCLSTEANCFLFPLYRFLTPEQQGALPGAQQAMTVANVRDELCTELSNAYGQAVTAEQVFHYTYAVLNAELYLVTYAEQLKADFPHIPFPLQLDKFQTMADLGLALANAHVGCNLPGLFFPFDSTDNNAIQFPVTTHIPASQTVRLNDSGASIGHITTEMWEYRIGTYQPLRDWLEARNGRIFVLEYPEPGGQVAMTGQYVLVDDYRDVARRIAAAIQIHQQINDAWNATVGAAHEPT